MENSKQNAGRGNCDFCGSGDAVRRYPTDVAGVEWRACAVCVVFIRCEEWDSLIDRIVAAYTALQDIADNELLAFRQELRKEFEQRSETPKATSSWSLKAVPNEA